MGSRPWSRSRPRRPSAPRPTSPAGRRWSRTGRRARRTSRDPRDRSRPPRRRRTGASAPTRARVRAIASQLIVSLALVRIAQHIVRLVDLLEALRRLSVVGIAIGMVLLGEPAERLLDLVHRRGLGDPQDLVIVLR